MTEPASRVNPESSKTLQAAVAVAGHEVRNALNGVVVNLEVVRSMAQSANFSAEPFLTQAIEQSEKSVGLAEAAIALMKLISGAVDPDGRIAWVGGSAAQVGIDGGNSAESIAIALRPLVERGVLKVERTGQTVILTIPDEGPY